ncbi:MAG: Nif3-like dinuclear metal center hexameric protein [bacterium]|nr:Nif3-like dinuclear metal center hexameric protein [bacterium]
MSILVGDIAQYLEEWAPAHLACDWDNVGLQIGNMQRAVSNVLVALEVDAAVLETVETGFYDLVITHHPLLFSPLKSINTGEDMGRIIKSFLNAETSLWSMHTNLDAAPGGVTDCLVKCYGLDPTNMAVFNGGIGKWLELAEPAKVSDLQAVLGGRVAGYCAHKTVSRIAFCGGSGKGLFRQAVARNIDLFITGEMGYHDEVFAELNHMGLLLLGHKESEVVVLPEIALRLKERFSCGVDIAPSMTLKL